MADKVKLTKAQMRALTAAQRSGGVVGFGQHARTIQILRDMGALTKNRDHSGYFNITPLGLSLIGGGE